jgi:hypothetical protein
MSFKHPRKQNSCDKVQRHPEKSTKPGVCQICGDKASFVNYGAFSCQSCKTFFRRRGFHPEVCIFLTIFLLDI